MTINKRKPYIPPSTGNAFKTPISVVTSIDRIMDRIAVATSFSPIAVFYRKQRGSSNLVAVFGSTAITKQLLTEPDFVGLFDKTMSHQRSLDKLKFASKGIY